MGIINEIEIEIFSDYTFQMSCDGLLTERILKMLERVREVLIEESGKELISLKEEMS